MNATERAAYINRFGANCFICGEYCGEQGRLVQSVVKMEVTKDEHTDPHVFQYYIACPNCRERKVLV